MTKATVMHYPLTDTKYFPGNYFVKLTSKRPSGRCSPKCCCSLCGINKQAKISLLSYLDTITRTLIAAWSDFGVLIRGFSYVPKVTGRAHVLLSTYNSRHKLRALVCDSQPQVTTTESP